jgi:osmoprotectant transport system substrate-binding protein
MRRALLLALLLAVAPALASVATAQPVRVGSKPDTEGALLGNVILKLLDAHHIPTQDRVGLGPTKIIRAALLAGQVDIYPEYTGNGAFFFGQESDPAWRDPQAGYERVRALDAPGGIVWLRAAPADNTWAIAVREDFAAANHLASMVDLARATNAGAEVKLAASAEFVESPAALPAFQRTYGFTLHGPQLLVLAGGNTAVTLRAAAEGTSGVNCAMAYGTDGALAALKLVVLTDPQHAQLVFAPAPVVRKAVLDAHPDLPAILDPAFAALDAPTLRTLNARIAVDGEDAGQVAADFLRKKGLLK